MTEQLYADPTLVPAGLGLKRAIEQALVIMPGYAADEACRRVGAGHPLYRCLGILWRATTTESYRGFVRGYRDFYANPRSNTYMATRLSDLASNAFPGASIRLIALCQPAQSDALGEHAGDIETLSVPAIDQLPDAIGAEIDAQKTDIALLLHHDALGLGLDAVEKQLIRQLPDRTFVMNGRRRVYRLTPRMQRRLALRRFLAETRIIELGLGTIIGPAARFGDKETRTA